jgi:hypothetical protein
MEPRKRYRVWMWVGGILAGLTIAGVVVVGLVVAGVVAGVSQLGKALSTETEVTIRPQTVNGQVVFEMTYGKDVTGLSVFIVQDTNGNELWRLDAAGSDAKPAKVVYGAIPTDPAGVWKQVFPADGKPPADIRGKHVKVEANCRYIIAMGAGHQSTWAEFDILK